MANSLFEQAYSFWNTFIELSMKMFTESPTTANGGSLYAVAHNAYLAIEAISIPLAILFFLFAIFKDIAGTPSKEQTRKLLISLGKLGILAAVLMNLWTIMGYIFQITDGVTDAIAINGNYKLTMDSGLKNVIREVESYEITAEISIWDFGTTFRLWMSQFEEKLKINGLLIGGGIAALLINIGAGLSILSSSYQRIIKPLIILPFSAITVAMASGTHESEQVTINFIKSLFGMCLSGAAMILCIKLGVTLVSKASSGLAFNLSTMDLNAKIVYYSAINAITPLVTAGLVKGVDGMISRFF